MAMPGCSNDRSSDEVFVVGDSLTVAATTLPQEMAERDVTLTGVDAVNGRFTEQGLEVLEEVGPALPEAVLVALGTNDIAGATERDVEEWVGRARQIVGDERRLIWVNVHIEPDREPEEPALARYVDFNRWLAAAADRHDVEVADWDGWAQDNDVRTKEDGIHYDRDASAARARFYALVVDGDIDTS